MTDKSNNNEGHELNQDLFPLIEDEQYPAEEPDHPGWLSIGEILKVSHPVFQKSKFLIGYHHSCNVYVLAGDYLTLVDPGNDYTIFAELEKFGYSPLDIKKVVLTHGHRDHCMGVFEMLRFPPIMENKSVEIIMHAAGPAEFKRIVTEAGFPPTELKGGETLELSGFEWEVIHTPGHTIDGICLYHEPTRTLISGDTVVPEAVSDVDKNGGGRWDHYLHGLKLLMKKDVAHVLPGHRVPVAMTGSRTIAETYENVLMKILDINPEDKVTWMEGARQLGEKGLLEEVVFCCDKELALRPENFHAMQLKALALNDMGRCEEAIDILEQILERRPDDAYALTAKGQALLGLQKPAESLPFFDEALAGNPQMTEAQVFKGMALTFLGRHDEAMAIEAFKNEFMARFQEQIDQRQQELKRGESDPNV
ncbi:MBL fold metallo-hydrolase [Desulfoferrobacter suflitae]|uniref:MBL fold metallo-hydrolase n=1 Tax=Desulfoferrobacter suflitae TaxID=2865782 RepID=UPI0021641399|nr:MBL fold metallo-hydrolase [Desulfoferrobacter suflitae]MCK8602221.1 MBL fold metallo-hydrolase [Desulfoferrobacter suflitae]